MIRVLHVDDEVGFLDLVSFFLKREGDFVIDTAITAESALEKMQSENYDAVVVDYSLPGMDGIELLKILRARGLQIPFVLFTGRGKEETAIQALNCGADFYLQKGASPQLLFTELANMLRKSVQGNRSEAAAREGERFLSSVFSSIQDGMSVLDNDLNILRVNQTMEDWYSHKMPLVGKKCYDAYHGRQAQCDSCPSIRTIESGKSAYEVVPKTGPKGEIIGWLDLYSFPMRDSKSGELSGVIEYVRDITDRRKAELELHDALGRYKELQGIIDKSPVIMVIWRPEPGSPVSFISDSVAQWGYKRDDFVSTLVYDDIIHKEDLEREKEEFRDFVRKGVDDFVQEYRIVTKSGEVRCVEDHTYVRRDSSGNPLGYEGIVLDVTDRKLALGKVEELASRLQTIVEAFPDLHFLVDAHGTILDFNAGRVTDLYVPPQKILGMKMQEVLPPDVGKIMESAIGEALKTGRIVAVEYSLEIEGGTRFYEARLAPIANDQILIVVRNVPTSKGLEEALRRSEERYRSLLDQAGDGIIVHDATGQIVDVNQRTCQSLGYSRQELLSKTIVNIDPDATRAEKGKLWDAVLAGERFTFESRQMRKDGSVIPVEVTLGPVRLPLGVAVIGIVRDITERKQAEDALQDSEKRYRLLVEGAAESILILQDGMIKMVNAMGTSMTGYSEQELLSKPFLTLIHPDDRAMVGERHQRRLSGEIVPNRYDFRVVAKDGSMKWVTVSAAAIKWEERPATLNLLTDITERKEAEDELRTSEKKYRELVNLAMEGILRTDADGVVLFANPRMADMLGYHIDEIVGRPAFQLMTEKNAELARRKLEQRSRGITDSYELDFLRKDGTSVSTSVGASPIKDKAGVFSGSLAVITDITDRKRYEDALKVANEKLNLLGQVTRHDALNQLAVLMGWLQIAQESVAEPPVQEYLKNMRTAAEAVIRQIDFTGDYEKMGVAKPGWIDVKTAFLSGIAGFSPGKLAKSVHVDGLEVYADTMFEKVFHNLADNSIRHGKKVTEIRVHYKRKGNDLLLFYEDDGVGVPADEKDKLFRRGIGDHTGFGLFMVRAILGITGITIEENGIPGHGVRFEMHVPSNGFRVREGAESQKR
jgi:PAS domain S-box-containing protein